jgi:hypothetical protein
MCTRLDAKSAPQQGPYSMKNDNPRSGKSRLRVPRLARNIGGLPWSQLQVADNNLAADTEAARSAYVPPLQRTAGQPPPVAAHGGLSYMAFDRNGDAGTAVALEDARIEALSGEERRLIDTIDNAPPGPIETQWGIGFRGYDECVDYIRANGIEAPEGGVVLPLRYTVYERSSYTVVPSNAIWKDPARADLAEILRGGGELAQHRPELYFPQVLRDARRIGEYYPGVSPNSPESMDRLGVSLAHLESKCSNFYDSAEVERVFYPEIEKLLLEFFPGATDALVYNHDVFDKDYTGDRTEDQDAKNPGVNAQYANIVHNDLNDNSGRVRCRELLTRNLRNTSGARSTTRRKRPPERCCGGSCRSISPSRWRRSSSFPSCSAPGPPSPSSRTSPITGSTTTASARPPASPTVPTMSGTGSLSRSPPRSRCSSVMTQ